MKRRTHLILYLLLSGFFLFLDQFLKYLARTNPKQNYYIWKTWLGWEYLENSGIAFSLPFPNFLIIILTPIILLGLIIFYTKKKNKTKLFHLGIFLIIAGAISNFIDRFLFEVTIDYLRILTSVINLADVMIVLGGGLLIINELKTKSKNTNWFKYL